ncbi:TPA: AAA family ATPase [Campylobacter jejuni]|uniref:AAA family ATPase n=1 Tax=Campylobacter jejuni TaxID=197 RepID=UPI00087454DB|nr:AAA family ATPase [Campylobacter jejuni]EAL7386453.1 anticodon nuclease [Campylobacter jejuni]ECQ4344390.1 AAA family ATPase [Campylobacter jejuni]ECR2110800.1 AAA family ATPase [Campylobacter jejuni]EED2612390.1 AAA family ATPase [Campylobacter jejuni]ELP1844314.1 AAA family ATPase [Campylobacter jejuni]
MSLNVPEIISKEEYKKLTNKTLNKPNFQQYKSFVTNNYKRSNDQTEYHLKEGLAEQVLIKLDFIFKRIGEPQFENLEEIAKYFRMMLDEERKKYILLFAYNGTGKTRLSAEFKTLGQMLNEETGEKTADTLYYNAFTEDLFYWDNDLENDTDRFLKLNSDSRFFSGLKELEMESRIRPFLHRYTDFDFTIDYDEYKISFYRNVTIEGVSQRIDNIKVSRGEENIFVWCFFLAIMQLVVDKEESYSWVKYIYIDDPISSLDDNNVIAVASHLVNLMSDADIKVVISSHHTLFYNVLCNEIDNPERLFFQRLTKNGLYILKDTSNTPLFYHVSLLKELKKVADSGKIYNYHFNILRNVLEKTAAFHGYQHFSSCLRKLDNDDDFIVHKRMVNIMSHGNYSVFEPAPLTDDNKEYFRNILDNFLEDYKFNQKIFDTE